MLASADQTARAAVVRHRPGLDDGHGRGNGAPVAAPAP
jgi:hypothetical protein